MWIIPKSLTSHFVQDTKVSELDSNSQGSILEQSLTARGKHTQSRTWLQRLKRVSWMRLLFLRMYVPSQEKNSLHTWLKESFPQDSHVSRFHQQVRDEERATLDTSGPISLNSFLQYGQELAFLKTSRVISHLDSERLQEIWGDWVTTLRQDFLARWNAVRHTRENAYSFLLPTPMATDHKRCYPESREQKEKRGRKFGENLIEVILEKPHSKLIEKMMGIPIGQTDFTSWGTE